MKLKKAIITVSVCLIVILVSGVIGLGVVLINRHDGLSRLKNTTFAGDQFAQVSVDNITVTDEPLNMATASVVERGIYGDGYQWPVGLNSGTTENTGMHLSYDGGLAWHLSLSQGQNFNTYVGGAHYLRRQQPVSEPIPKFGR